MQHARGFTGSLGLVLVLAACGGGAATLESPPLSFPSMIGETEAIYQVDGIAYEGHPHDRWTASATTVVFHDGGTGTPPAEGTTFAFRMPDGDGPVTPGQSSDGSFLIGVETASADVGSDPPYVSSTFVLTLDGTRIWPAWMQDPYDELLDRMGGYDQSDLAALVSDAHDALRDGSEMPHALVPPPLDPIAAWDALPADQRALQDGVAPPEVLAQLTSDGMAQVTIPQDMAVQGDAAHSEGTAWSIFIDHAEYGTVHAFDLGAGSHVTYVHLPSGPLHVSLLRSGSGERWDLGVLEQVDGQGSMTLVIELRWKDDIPVPQDVWGDDPPIEATGYVVSSRT